MQPNIALVRALWKGQITWTGRRYAMSLHRYWPEVEKVLVTVDSFSTPRAHRPGRSG